MQKKCALCEKSAVLKKSHIVPSFVGKWLKDTSPTGFVRQVVNPNKRIQDVTKQELLCGDCENLFSVYEGAFAKNIFYPYVREELDEWYVAQGKVKEIRYEEWLLKFAISLQWRALWDSKYEDLNIDEKAKSLFKKVTDKALLDWKNYLLGKASNSGDSRHYILFMQNLASGDGFLPDLSPKVNTYLCRAIDSTFAFSNSHLFLYTKLGPIIFISGLVPNQFKGMNNALIHLGGCLSTAQSLANPEVNQFIFITRPKEAISAFHISEKQEQIILKDVLLGVKKNKGVSSVLLGYSDHMMSKGNRME